MTDKTFYTIEEDPEGIVWKMPLWKNEVTTPYCKEHLVPLLYDSLLSDDLECPRGDESFELKYTLQKYREYVYQVVRDGELEDLQIVRLDNKGSAVLARETNKTNPLYFIESKLSDTKKGLELMIQVGKKDGSKKVQLFVDLPAERMGFDTSDKDRHPSGLFTEVKATFKDSSTIIEEK